MANPPINGRATHTLVNVKAVTLTIDTREVLLTLKLARSLPITTASNRYDRLNAGLEVPKALCKVLTTVLMPERSSIPDSMMILVEDPSIGLCWTEPINWAPEGREEWLDDLTAIPTIILP